VRVWNEFLEEVIEAGTITILCRYMDGERLRGIMGAKLRQMGLVQFRKLGRHRRVGPKGLFPICISMTLSESVSDFDGTHHLTIAYGQNEHVISLLEPGMVDAGYIIQLITVKSLDLFKILFCSQAKVQI